MWDLTLFNSALFPSHNLFNPHFTLFLQFLPFLPLSLLHRHILYMRCVYMNLLFSHRKQVCRLVQVVMSQPGVLAPRSPELTGDLDCSVAVCSPPNVSAQMATCSQRAAGSSRARAAHRRVSTTPPVCPGETATCAGEAKAALTFFPPTFITVMGVVALQISFDASRLAGQMIVNAGKGAKTECNCTFTALGIKITANSFTFTSNFHFDIWDKRKTLLNRALLSLEMWFFS